MERVLWERAKAFAHWIAGTEQVIAAMKPKEEDMVCAEERTAYQEMSRSLARSDFGHTHDVTPTKNFAKCWISRFWRDTAKTFGVKE